MWRIVVADDFLPIRCPNCRACLGRLYGGTGIVISFKCRCHTTSIFRIDEAKATVLATPLLRPSASNPRALRTAAN